MENRIDKGEEALSEAETQRLKVYEAAVEAGFSSQSAQILAAAQIRDERLYRAEYGTFENYCEKRWGKSKRTVNALIQAARVIRELGWMGQTSPHPTAEKRPAGQNSAQPNIAQAIALSRLADPAERQAENRTYSTWGVAVPIKYLYRAMNRACIIKVNL